MGPWRPTPGIDRAELAHWPGLPPALSPTLPNGVAVATPRFHYLIIFPHTLIGQLSLADLAGTTPQKMSTKRSAYRG